MKKRNTEQESKELSASEWKVMNALWRIGQGALGEIHAATGHVTGRHVTGRHQEWSPETVKTLLRRLVAKGYVKTHRVGSSFLYLPNKPATTVLKKAGETLLGYAVDGTVAPLMAHMIKGGKLTQDELQSLRNLLDRLTADEEGDTP